MLLRLAYIFAYETSKNTKFIQNVLKCEKYLETLKTLDCKGIKSVKKISE